MHTEVTGTNVVGPVISKLVLSIYVSFVTFHARSGPDFCCRPCFSLLGKGFSLWSLPRLTHIHLEEGFECRFQVFRASL